MLRRKTQRVQVGKIEIGGDAPISIQSMTNTDTTNIDATLKQVLDLESAGCQIVRLAIYDESCISTIQQIKSHTDIPLVADIHFDYRLAILSMEAGIDKVRINPGNIGSLDKVKQVVDSAKIHHTPIRIGVNAGSLERNLLERYGNSPKAMGESVLQHISLLEKLHFFDIVVSLKSSSVVKTIDAYRYISQQINYPLHLGVTEAGTSWSGTIRSAIGIGTLLTEGIGDTLRVSLTASPIEEVKVGQEILKSLELRKEGIEIISCPTCGRCNVDLISLANELNEKLSSIKQPIKLAVMGCVVNGPGEAKDADIGIAGGKGKFVLFKKGQVIGTFPQDKAVEILISMIREMIDNENGSHHTSL